MQFRNFDAPSRPQVVTINWRREVADDEYPDISWLEEDCEKERLNAYRRGDFCFVGIRAVAEITIPIGQNSFTTYKLASPGLWGIESDSGEDYFNEIFGQEKAELISHLKTLGEHIATLD